MKIVKSLGLALLLASLFLAAEVSWGGNSAKESNDHGVKLASQGKFGEAQTAFEQALKLDPFLEAAKLCLEILEDLRTEKIGREAALRFFKSATCANKDQAIAELNRALKINPNFAAAYLQRGNKYIESGQYDRAIADYNRAIELNPKFEAAYLMRGWTYGKKGQLDLALADYNKIIEFNPRYAYAYYDRGKTYHRKGDLDQAITNYNSAIELNPNYAQALLSRGIAYEDRGQYDLSVADYSRALELNPKNNETFRYRGDAYQRKGDLELAIADYCRALELNPKNAGAYTSRGNAYRRKGEFERALKDFDLALKMDPKDPASYFNKALTYEKLGRKEEALVAYRSFLKFVDPKNENQIQLAQKKIKNLSSSPKPKACHFKDNSEPDGFRDIKWGTDIATLLGEGYLLQNKSNFDPERHFYIKKNDNLKIGDINLGKILYIFQKNKFIGVFIVVSDKKNEGNLSKLKDYLIKSYGDCSGNGQNRDFDGLAWAGNNSFVMYFYGLMKKFPVGMLFIIEKSVTDIIDQELSPGTKEKQKPAAPPAK